MNLFEFYEKDELVVKNGLQKYILKLKKRARLNHLLFPFYTLLSLFTYLSYIFHKSIKKYVKQPVILIVGEKHYSTLDNYSNLVVLFSAKSLLKNFKSIFLNGHKAYVYEGYYKYIAASYNEPDSTQILENKIKAILKGSKVQIILMGNDNKPLERLWIKVARELGITSVVYQHGVWAANNMLAYQADGWAADYLFVYDAFHKDLMIKFGMNPDKIIIVGFPKVESNENVQRENNTVCILGSAGFSSGYGDYFKKANNRIALILVKAGYNVFYRPHPSEIKDSNFEVDSELVTIVTGEPITAAVKKYQVYVGFASTMLIECTISGGLAIQIIDDKIDVIDFQKMQYAYSIRLNDLEKTLINSPSKQKPLALPFELIDSAMAKNLNDLVGLNFE